MYLAQSPLARWLGARRAANARHAAAEPRALPPTPPTHSGKMCEKLVKNDVIKALFGRNCFFRKVSVSDFKRFCLYCVIQEKKQHIQIIHFVSTDVQLFQ